MGDILHRVAFSIDFNSTGVSLRHDMRVGVLVFLKLDFDGLFLREDLQLVWLLLV